MATKKSPPAAPRVSGTHMPPHPDPADPAHQEWVIDEGDEESFPASDPSAITQPHRKKKKEG